MKKVLQVDEISTFVTKQQIETKRIVLAGGCFDMLHGGHLSFLEAARSLGDILVVLLESDEAISQRKGKGRPIKNNQARIKNLLTNTPVDYVIVIPFPFTDQDYDKLVTSLKPAIIATTKGDPYRHHKERQAKLVQAKVVDVIERIAKYSTTNLLSQL